VQVLDGGVMGSASRRRLCWACIQDATQTFAVCADLGPAHCKKRRMRYWSGCSEYSSPIDSRPRFPAQVNGRKRRIALGWLGLTYLAEIQLDYMGRG
jgi:hypothetical protein